jgi:hypothetical protein
MEIRKITTQALKLSWIGLLPIVSLASSIDRNTDAMISVSGGIAMPSYTTAPASNPAAAVSPPGTIAVVQAGSNSALSSIQLRGGLAFGNGSVGIAAGGTYTTTNTAEGAYFALGFGLESIHTQLGFSGTIGISPSTGSNFNAGLLFMPTSAWSLGLTAIGLANSGGIGELGAGLGLHLSPNVSFIVDAAFSNSLTYLAVQPGLKVGTDNAAITISYGSGSGSSQLANSALAAGGALKFANRLLWEIYYNKFSTYYTGISFQF